MAELITNYTPQGNSLADTLMTGMKMQYMQNQMQEHEAQNALRAYKMQQDEMKYQNDLLQFKRDSLAKIAPGEYGNWRKMIESYDRHADLLLPQESDFMDSQEDGTTKFNTDRFTNWQKRNIMTASDVLDRKGSSWDQFWVENSEGRRLPYFHKKGEQINESSVTSMFGPGWKFVGGAEEKPKSESFDTFTLYGPKGQTKRVSVAKGEGYVPETGWSLKAPKDSEPGTWDYIGTDDEGQAILKHSKSGTLKIGTTPDGKPIKAKPGKDKKVDVDKLNSTIAMNNENFAPVATHVENFNKSAGDANFSYWEGNKGGVVKIGYGLDSQGNQITNADVWAEAKRSGKSFGDVVGRLQEKGMAQYIEMPKK
jgi:type II secretory pathway pseudopilin PulG